MLQRARTREPQYDVCLDAPAVQLPPMAAYHYATNAMRMLFSFARYKWVARHFAGMDRVAEIGCGDAFYSRVVKQAVEELELFDFDPVWMQYASAQAPATVHDILQGVLPSGRFSGIYMLDVLEHIAPLDEPTAMWNICESLQPDGVFIAGIPSLESQAYASDISKAGHINCKSGEQLKSDAGKFFRNVSLYTMNDEFVGTGFPQMAHYLFIYCTGPRAPSGWVSR